MNHMSKRQIIWMMMILGYLSIPFVYAAYMFYLLSAGAFPPDSDAIMIPIMGVTILWFFIGIIIGAAFVIWKVISSLRRN